jgi:hypothetical protein
MRKAALISAFFFMSFSAASAKAQQRSADLHLDYVRGLVTDANSWGAGAALQLTWGGESAPVKLNTSPGVDYTKQSGGGPGQTSLALDATVQPGGNSALTPYAGGSASANWSSGTNSQWSGSRLGLEAIGGLQFKPSTNSSLSWKAEERYGYVRGQEHTLATRVGVLISI